MRIQLDTFDLIIRRIFFIYREIITDLADQCRLDKMLNIWWIYTTLTAYWRDYVERQRGLREREHGQGPQRAKFPALGEKDRLVTIVVEVPEILAGEQD